MSNTSRIENSTSPPLSPPGNRLLDILKFSVGVIPFPLGKNGVQMPPLVSYYAIKCPGPLYIQGK